MTEYRICFNQAPHRKDWWTVEKTVERKRLFRKPVTEWEVVKYVFAVSMTTGLIMKALTFDTKKAAQDWVAEDRRPKVHECEAA